jgi:neutral ceramidase
MRYCLLLPFLLLLLIGNTSCLIGRIDRRPYTQSSYYQRFVHQFDTLRPENTGGDTLRAGWAKTNINPKQRIHLAGYGSRAFRKYSTVHDTVYLRVIVMGNGLRKAALVTGDLLIMPPEVVKLLVKKLSQTGWKSNELYLSATHTHNGPGGWARRPLGRLLAGKYRQSQVTLLADSLLSALEAATRQMEKVRIGYVKTLAGELVNPRWGPEAVLDRQVRFMGFQQASGKTALVVVFQAHATNLPNKEMALSGDYPAALCDSLEKSLDFVAFCAGGVGGHSPRGEGESFQRVGWIARQLADTIRTHLRHIK